MKIKIIKEKISKSQLEEIAKQGFGTIVKMAIDIENELIALGGEWHSECQEALVKNGSSTENIWGANINFNAPEENRIEFNSLINIKPTLGSQKMEISDEKIKKQIKQIVDKLVEYV